MTLFHQIADSLAWPALVSRLGWLLVHSLWQFMLIALVAGVAEQLLRKQSAAARYGVLVAAMVLMVLSLLVTLALLQIDPPRHPIKIVAIPQPGQSLIMEAPPITIQSLELPPPVPTESAPTPRLVPPLSRFVSTPQRTP